MLRRSFVPCSSNAVSKTAAAAVATLSAVTTATVRTNFLSSTTTSASKASSFYSPSSISYLASSSSSFMILPSSVSSQRFFSGIQLAQNSTTTTTDASNNTKKKPSPLIFNPLNGRMQLKKAKAFQQLSELGIESPDDDLETSTSTETNSSNSNNNRHLFTESELEAGILKVTDSQKLIDFALKVRENPSEMPKDWGPRMRQVLGGMLRSPVEESALPEMVNNYLKQAALDRVYRKDMTGAIGGVSANSSSSSSPTSSSASLDQQEKDEQEHEMLKRQQQLNSNNAVSLTTEQKRVIELALQGYNLYIGGDAGTGKTVVLTELYRALRAKRLTVAVTASTGLAACHLGGSTFHSFCGIGKASDFLQASKAMPLVDVIVIDEVSMLSGALIDRFDHFLRGERQSNAPFGGTQIIICGDFLQLGFIVQRSDFSNYKEFAKVNSTGVFDLDVFKRHFLHLKLVQQVRQSEHPRFGEQLRELRLGNVPEDLWDNIRRIDDPESNPPAPETIRLLPTNEQVKEANEARLAQLPGELIKFLPSATSPTLSGTWSTTVVLEVCPDSFNPIVFKQNLHELLLSGINPEKRYYMPSSSVVVYKTHPDGCVARVLFPSNKPEVAQEFAKKWEDVISQMGKIDCTDPNSTISSSSSSSVKRTNVLDVLKDGDGLHTAEIEERLNQLVEEHPVAQTLPLKIGAPVLLRVNLSNRLVNGSVGTVVDYVPASAEKLPKHFAENRLMAKALEQYVQHAQMTLGIQEPVVPIVKFRSEKQEVPIPPWPFTVGGDASTQFYTLDAVSIPLTLAYAFTVHKVQGLTLLADVRIELEKMWDCDHVVYVGMSRVKSPKQLEISGFKDSIVQAHEGAVRFDKLMPRVCDVEPHPEMVRAFWRQVETGDIKHPMFGTSSSFNNNNNNNSENSTPNSFHQGALRTAGSNTGPAVPDYVLRAFKRQGNVLKQKAKEFNSNQNASRRSGGGEYVAPQKKKKLSLMDVVSTKAPSTPVILASAAAATSVPAPSVETFAQEEEEQQAPQETQQQQEKQEQLQAQVQEEQQAEIISATETEHENQQQQEEEDEQEAASSSTAIVEEVPVPSPVSVVSPVVAKKKKIIVSANKQQQQQQKNTKTLDMKKMISMMKDKKRKQILSQRLAAVQKNKNKSKQQQRVISGISPSRVPAALQQKRKKQKMLAAMQKSKSKKVFFSKKATSSAKSTTTSSKSIVSKHSAMMMMKKKKQLLDMKKKKKVAASRR